MNKEDMNRLFKKHCNEDGSNSTIYFKVVPICDKQRMDIDDKHILENGLYRTCDIYKGGGGYDKFPEICNKRLGLRYSNQFVVQLQGCTLRCPYCYVTEEGIFGDDILVSAEDLVNAFNNSNQDVFHLMGGAPALYIEDWYSIINILDPSKVFHSDLLLTERGYDDDVLLSINKPNTIYAVSIKGFGIEYLMNTGVEFNSRLFWKNLDKVISNNLNFYFTYTNMTDSSINEFKSNCKLKLKNYNERIFEDEFKIELIEYEALK